MQLTVPHRVVLATALVAVLVWHAWQKPPELRAEMLWACHVASAAMALGLAAGWAPVVAGAFVYHAAVGFPSWMAETIVTRTTTFTSALAHLLPLGCGAFALWRARWPRGHAAISWASQVPLFFISHVATPPALNVNVAHAPWPPLGLHSVWAGAAVHLAWTLVALLGANAILRRLLARKRTGKTYQRYMSPGH